MVKSRFAVFGIGFVALFVFMIPPVHSLPIGGNWWVGRSYTWVGDNPVDSRPNPGSTFEVYGIGYAIENGCLFVHVDTKLPIAGAMARDSYGDFLFSPGDLYLNVGGTFQAGTGSVHGIGTLTHANIVPQAYSDTWTQVTSGNLYNGSLFADGTYEGYTTGFPSDGNDFDGINQYPTLIRQGTEVVGKSGFSYQANGAGGNIHRYHYWVELASIGVLPGPTGSSMYDLQITWSMECGNDLAQVKMTVEAVPEPMTLVTLVGGIGGLALRNARRKRR